jgi:DNA-binding CsgD family transcriptional regulator
MAIELNADRTMNPLVNAGAIATTSLVPGTTADEKFESIVAAMSQFAGRRLVMDDEVYESEAATNDRNRGIAHLLDGYGRMYCDPDLATDVYTRQCSIRVSARDLAVMGATLANGGVNPVTGEQAIETRHCKRVEILVERDELDDAAAVLGRIAPPLASHTVVVAAYLMARGQLRMAQGRGQEALQDFLACGERCERLGILDGLYGWRSEAAITHAMLGHAAEGQRLAQEAVEVARGFGRPRGLGVALRAAGLAEGGERGLDLLDEAVAVLERSEAPVELARTLTDHGAALRRAGQRMRARAQLERGLDLAHHLGARRIAHQARSELIAAGAKPRRDAITGRDALTASELRVARLAAAGKTNREIAQILFITMKTASAHLSRVYRKLDVTRRSQLAEALISDTPIS